MSAGLNVLSIAGLKRAKEYNAGLSKMKQGTALADQGRALFNAGLLQSARALAEARAPFVKAHTCDNNGFRAWLDDNGFDRNTIGKNDRQALARMGRDEKILEIVLVNTQSWTISGV